MARTSRLWTCFAIAGAAIAHTYDVNAAEAQKTEMMRMERKKAAQRRRRIIMNNDGNDGRALDPGEEKTPETFLSKRISPLAGSQVAAIFYCTGVFSLGGISSGLGGSTTCRSTPA